MIVKERKRGKGKGRKENILTLQRKVRSYCRMLNETRNRGLCVLFNIHI